MPSDASSSAKASIFAGATVDEPEDKEAAAREVKGEKVFGEDMKGQRLLI